MKNKIAYGYATLKFSNFVISGIKDICKIEKENPDPDKSLLKTVKKAIQNKEIILAFNGSSPIGFIWGTFTKKVPYGINFGNEKKTFCWISWSYVIKSERNKGIGKSLYKQIELECKKRKINQIRLDVFTINKNSEKFHLNLGYRPQLSIYKKTVN